MADREGPNPARERIWNDSAEGLTVSGPGPEHSEEAIRILTEQGTDAYLRYLAENR